MKRNIRAAWPLLAAASLVAWGCDAIFGDDYDVRLQTDKEDYFATTSTEIMMSIENRGDNAVYYRCGGDVRFERFIDGDLDDTLGLPNCASLDPNPIEAGETEDRTITIDEIAVKWITEAFTEQAGGETITYRLRLELFEDTEFEVELDAENQRSNEFTISPPNR